MGGGRSPEGDYSNECSGPGKTPPRTSSAYSLAARSSSARRSAYFFTNFGTRPPLRPAMSGQTSTWASQSAPAPMPMVGMDSSLVTCPAISAGTISRTTANAPASWTACASASSCSAPARGLAGALGGEDDQQQQRVAVGGDGVRAGLPLPDEPVGKERLQGRGERGHPRPPRCASRRPAASASSSGAACRYQ